MSLQATIPDLTRIFVPVTVKTDASNPGVRIVSGIATDPTLDSDRQICDPSWLEKAMSDYEPWGNIREMHQPIAAGVAISIVKDADAYVVTSKIIDPGTIAKLDAGVLKGYSIGIAHPQVIRDNKAIGGRIIGGEIIEISLVDRPANPNALIDHVEFAEKMEKVFLEPEVSKAIPHKEGEPKSPPKGYPKDKSAYADPENYSWPIDTPTRVRSAMAYYNAGKGKDKYSSGEWSEIGNKIA